MGNYKIISDTTKTIRKLTSRIIVMKHSNNTPMDEKDVKELIRMIETKIIKQKGTKPMMYVRAKTILGDITLDGIDTREYMTIKATDKAVDSMFDDLEQYLENRAIETTKYKQYYQIEITLKYSNKK